MVVRRLKVKNIIILVVIFLVLIFGYPFFNIIRVVSCGYSFGSAYKINSLNIKDKVIESKYSKTLDKIINKDYNFKYLDNYLELDYYDYDDFGSMINKLLDLGYSSSEINIINKMNSSSVIGEIIKHDYDRHLVKYMDYEFYKDEYLYRYLEYYTGDYKETIIKVNIGLDMEVYTDSNVVSSYSIDMFTNKHNRLSDEYVPSDLVLIKSSCASSSEYLAKDAAVAFEKMCSDMQSEGMLMMARAAYRSFDEQQSTYDTYLNLYGSSYVKTHVALAGYSEHQTGLAVDVMQVGYNTFANSPSYKWLIENSYKYGFILRYPNGDDDITQFQYEPWHYRYVGVDIATKIYEEGITFDEYYAMYLVK